MPAAGKGALLSSCEETGRSVRLIPAAAAAAAAAAPVDVVVANGCRLMEKGDDVRGDGDEDTMRCGLAAAQCRRIPGATIRIMAVIGEDTIEHGEHSYVYDVLAPLIASEQPI